MGRISASVLAATLTILPSAVTGGVEIAAGVDTRLVAERLVSSSPYDDTFANDVATSVYSNQELRDIALQLNNLIDDGEFDPLDLSSAGNTRVVELAQRVAGHPGAERFVAAAFAAFEDDANRVGAGPLDRTSLRMIGGLCQLVESLAPARAALLADRFLLSVFFYGASRGTYEDDENSLACQSAVRRVADDLTASTVDEVFVGDQRWRNWTAALDGAPMSGSKQWRQGALVRNEMLRVFEHAPRFFAEFAAEGGQAHYSVYRYISEIQQGSSDAEGAYTRRLTEAVAHYVESRTPTDWRAPWQGEEVLGDSYGLIPPDAVRLLGTLRTAVVDESRRDVEDVGIIGEILDYLQALQEAVLIPADVAGTVAGIIVNATVGALVDTDLASTGNQFLRSSISAIGIPCAPLVTSDIQSSTAGKLVERAYADIAWGLGQRGIAEGLLGGGDLTLSLGDLAALQGVVFDCVSESLSNEQAAQLQDTSNTILFSSWAVTTSALLDSAARLAQGTIAGECSVRDFAASDAREVQEILGNWESPSGSGSLYQPYDLLDVLSISEMDDGLLGTLPERFDLLDLELPYNFVIDGQFPFSTQSGFAAAPLYSFFDGSAGAATSRVDVPAMVDSSCNRFATARAVDGALVASAQVQVWVIETADRLVPTDLDSDSDFYVVDRTTDTPTAYLLPCIRYCYSVTISADGSTVAALEDAPGWLLWERTRPHAPLHVNVGFQVSSLDLSPDGSTVAVIRGFGGLFDPGDVYPYTIGPTVLDARSGAVLVQHDPAAPPGEPVFRPAGRTCWPHVTLGAWSLGGTDVAVLSYIGQCLPVDQRRVVLDIIQSGVRNRVLNETSLYGQGGVSPDRELFVFSRITSESSELVLFDRSGTDLGFPFPDGQVFFGAITDQGLMLDGANEVRSPSGEVVASFDPPPDYRLAGESLWVNSLVWSRNVGYGRFGRQLYVSEFLDPPFSESRTYEPMIVVDPALPVAVGLGASGLSALAGPGLSVIEAPIGPVPPLPPGVNAPHGPISFEVRNLARGDTVQVTVSGLDPSVNTYYKLVDGTWQDFTSIARFPGDGTMILTLTDGGLGDLDGMANGRVLDPGLPVMREVVGCAVVDTAGIAGWWRGDGATSAQVGPQLSGTDAYTNGRTGQAFDITPTTPLAATGVAQPTTGLTLELWVKPQASTGVVQTLISRWSGVGFTSANDDGHAYNLELYPNSELVFETDDVTTRFPEQLRVNASQLVDGSFHHIAATWTPTTMTLYIDGMQVATKASQGGQLQTGGTTPVRVGGPFGFTGVIDEPTIWARALTPAEIGVIASAAGGKCP